MGFTLTVAWRNLFRQGRRTAITAGAMGMAVALCMAMWAWVDGMMGQMFDRMVTDQLGHVQVHHTDYPTRHQLYDTIGDAEGLLGRIDALPDSEAATGRLVTFALVGTEQKSTGARLVGVEPGREDAINKIGGKIKAGRWLTEDDHKGERGIPAAIGQKLAKSLKVEVGSQIVLIGQASDGSLANELLDVVGTFRSGNAAMDRAGAYLPLADLQDVLILPDQVHEIVVIGPDDATVPALADEVKDAASPDLLVRTWRETDPVSAQMMSMTDGMMVVLLGVVFAVAGLGVLNTMLMAVFERTRELGLLKALGVKPGGIIRLIVAESFLLAVLASAAGLVFGGLLDWYIVTHGIELTVGGEGFEYEGVTFDPVLKGAFSWGPVFWTLGSVIVVCVLAGLWPAWRASRLRPVDAMRHV